MSKESHLQRVLDCGLVAVVRSLAYRNMCACYPALAPLGRGLAITLTDGDGHASVVTQSLDFPYVLARGLCFEPSMLTLNTVPLP